MSDYRTPVAPTPAEDLPEPPSSELIDHVALRRKIARAVVVTGLLLPWAAFGFGLGARLDWLMAVSGFLVGCELIALFMWACFEVGGLNA